MEYKVTSIEELKSYSKGQIVQLPDFNEGQPFFARLRRPSMLALAKSGKIPNALIHTANELFNGKGMNDKKETAMPEVLSIIDILASSCFVEPTYKELLDAGIELTDEQMMAIFNYVQRGVKALEPFRAEPKNSIAAINESKVQKNPV